MRTSNALRSLYSALVSIAAVLASFGVMYALCNALDTNASPAILAAALSVGLMRRAEPFERRALLTRFLMLPFVAVAAGLVGYTLLKLPVLGAVLFSGGIALSILLRKYGPRAAALGRVIALPLMSILVVPVRIEVSGSAWVALLLVIAAGVVALASTTLFSQLAARLGLEVEPEPSRIARPPSANKAGISIAARMALQMLVALGLAFAIGFLAFPEHWFWIVLTAFIVCSGAVDRGDAVYKGLLRLGGAAGGALVAAVVARIPFPDPAAYAAAVFFVLFLGIWLRQINYAWWAACATLIFALLQGSRGADMGPLLASRLLGIVVGALCGVAATWFIYPIRTEQLVRRRVADALGALRDVLTQGPDHPGHPASLAALDQHDAELARIAPPVHLHWKLFGAKDPDQHPATWIKLMRELLAHARTPGFDRKHVGAGMKRLGSMLKGKSPDSPSSGSGASV